MLIPPDVRQVEDHDCGPACLRSVLQLFGRPDSRPIPHTPQDGCDPRTVEHVLRQHGLQVIAGEMSIADLAHHTRAYRPVMCPIQLHGSGHWVIVAGVVNGHVWFHDPLAGMSSLRLGQFLSNWHDTDRLPAIWDSWGVAVWER